MHVKHAVLADEQENERDLFAVDRIEVNGLLHDGERSDNVLNIVRFTVRYGKTLTEAIIA